MLYQREEVTEALIVSEEVTKEEIVQKIHLYADKYNVSFDRMYKIIDCETAHTFDANIQSHLVYTFSSRKRGFVTGEREQSYGLAQIHLPDHPQITEQQAKDVDFALNFMALSLSKGQHLWYCEK
jgi:hypothetical protein